MQGSFEKKVQEKLDELRLTPSEPVWKAIEKEIRPEKRRRFPFWIPFIIFMLGGAAWWMLGTKNEENAIVTSTPAAASNRTNEAANKPVPLSTETKPVQTTTTTSLPEKNNTAIREQTPRQANGFDQPAIVKPIRVNIATGQTILSKKPEAINPSKEIRSASAIEENSTSSKENTPENVSPTGVAKTTTATPQMRVVSPVETKTGAEDSLSNRNEKLSDSSTVMVTQKMDSLPVTKDTVAAKTKLASAKKGWQKTVLFNVGRSQYTDWEVGQNLRADLNSPAPGYNNGIGGNPSSVNSGLGFQLGFGLKKELHSRWEISIGLQYAHYSTKTKVGEYKAIDTAVIVPNGNLALQGYYKNANLKDYAIRYGILELPVSISFRPLARLPLTLTAGASYGRLLHSNVLQFDRWANIYYRDKEAVNKSLFAGFASLQYTLLNKAAWRLDAGPVVQYHFSNLHRNSTDKRLFFAGLKTAVTF